jgi:hypothetical protein
MNTTQLLELSGIDLAKRVAQGMGYTIHAKRDITGAAPLDGRYCFVDPDDGRGLLCWEPHRPLREFRPDRNRAHVDLVLTHVADMEAQSDYLAALGFCLKHGCAPWSLLTANTEDLCRAFVLLVDH